MLRLAALFALLACAKPEIARAPVCLVSPPDILVIVLDDIGLLNGNLGDPVQASTPNLDALAAQGVSFTRCYGAPTCQPARYALHTGHWWTSDAGISQSAPGTHTPAFAEKFAPERLSGYASALFGKWHLGGCQIKGASWTLAPASQGFDYAPMWQPANVGFSYFDFLSVNWQLPAQVTDYYADELVDAFLDGYAVPLGVPRLTYLNHAFAHAPFHDPPPGHGPFGELAQPIVKYEWMIERADADLGAILAAVDLDDTLVIVVGDNGTPPQAGGQRAKETCYERGLRVPLIVAGAGVTQQGTTSDELVWIGDVYATVIHAGGGTLPVSPLYPIQSKDLAPLLTGGPGWLPHGHVITGHNWKTAQDNAQRCIVTEDGWKLIQWDEDEDADVVTISREELYDLAADPGEATDELANQGQLADALRAILDAECLP